MFGRYTFLIGFDSSYSTLHKPDVLSITGFHPVQKPDVVITHQAREVTNRSQLIYTFPGLRPSIADVAQKNEMIFCTLKT